MIINVMGKQEKTIHLGILIIWVFNPSIVLTYLTDEGISIVAVKHTINPPRIRIIHCVLLDLFA